MKTINAELTNELRMNDFAGDPWGTAMSAMFDVCEHMTVRGLDVPTEFGYRPSILGVRINEESEFYELISTATDSDLLRMGLFLNKLLDIVKSKGLDY